MATAACAADCFKPQQTTPIHCQNYSGQSIEVHSKSTNSLHCIWPNSAASVHTYMTFMPWVVQTPRHTTFTVIYVMMGRLTLLNVKGERSVQGAVLATLQHGKACRP